MNLEKSVEIASLYGFYKNLLTEKQQNIFERYYLQDIGLTEISEVLGVTKQTVLDTLKKTEKNLFEMENALKLFKIYESQSIIIKEVKQTKDLSNLDKLLNCWED